MFIAFHVVANNPNSQRKLLQHNRRLRDRIRTMVTKALPGCVVDSSPIYSHVPGTHQRPQDRISYHNCMAYALHRTKLHSSVTSASLVLLQRLKARFPTARGSSGHRLFISAFMIASKVIRDDTYSNKSWSIVRQGMFRLREINQMEREMCQYLDWELNVEPSTLKEFEGA
jgi:hypothetical protein